MTKCIFCDIAAKKIPSKIVHEDADLVAFRDANPQAPTHILIIPRKHIPTVNALTAQDVALVGKLCLAAKELAQREKIADSGYRLVLNCNAEGGQSVFHIHLHLIGGRPMHWPPG